MWNENELDERNDEGVLRWFGHGDRIEHDGIALVVAQWVGHRRHGLIP